MRDRIGGNGGRGWLFPAKYMYILLSILYLSLSNADLVVGGIVQVNIFFLFLNFSFFFSWSIIYIQEGAQILSVYSLLKLHTYVHTPILPLPRWGYRTLPPTLLYPFQLISTSQLMSTPKGNCYTELLYHRLVLPVFELYMNEIMP